MDEIYGTKRGGHVCSPESLKCPEAIDMLRVGVICCRLDKGLTLLWGNHSFYRMTGYSEEDFCLLFGTLQRYYESSPDDFDVIIQSLEESRGKGDSVPEFTVRVPLKGGRFFVGTFLWHDQRRRRGRRSGAPGRISRCQRTGCRERGTNPPVPAADGLFPVDGG